MEKLLPEHLKDFWHTVERNEHSREDYTREYDRAIAEYRQVWERALSLPAHDDLRESLLAELGNYTQCADSAEVRRRCEEAVPSLKRDWEKKVRSEDRRSVEKFYDESPAMLHELMWWHTLGDDLSPLAYVLALRFAQQHGCKSYLDFGAGVGAGGLLFARHGLQTTLADISSPLLRFSAWRLGLRNLPAQYLDLKSFTCQGVFRFYYGYGCFRTSGRPSGSGREALECSQARRFPLRADFGRGRRESASAHCVRFWAHLRTYARTRLRRGLA